MEYLLAEAYSHPGYLQVDLKYRLEGFQLKQVLRREYIRSLTKVLRCLTQEALKLSISSRLIFPSGREIYKELTRRRSRGSRIAFAFSVAAPRKLTNREKPPANASANASFLPSALSSNHKPRMTNVFVVRSSLLSKRATS